MNTALYIIGQPGAGKAALLRHALCGVPVIGTETKPFAHIVYHGGIQLGRDRDSFGGADSLSSAACPLVLLHLDHQRPAAVIAQGDLLARSAYFEGLTAMGYALDIVYLNTPDALAKARRTRRGGSEDQAWIKGKQNKALRLAHEYARTWLDGSLPMETLAQQVRRLPAVDALYTALATKEHANAQAV